jgi:AcrR family transcriptional regulator
MAKTNNAAVWTEEGYTLFANEGLEGIQIERLARTLNLNKSGFYHYFGNLQGFCNELLKLHEKKAELFLEEIKEIKTIDPEYLEALERHRLEILFHIRLIRSKSTSLFYNVAERIDQQEEQIIREVWTAYIGFQDQPDLAIRYFSIVRDMLYTRLNSDNVTFLFMQGLMTEAKTMMQQIVESKSTLETRDSHMG